MPANLLIKNVPDHVADRLRQRANLHGCSLQDELLAIVETAARDEWRNAPMAGFAEEHQAGFEEPRRASHLEEVLEQIRTLPDDSQQEVVQLLLAYLDEEDSDFGLSPEQIAEIERRAADDGPYATDEEVREVFARLTK